ncbi:hypothetical protein ACWC9F_30265 [Streptomyces sp. NPDC001110]
MFFAVPFAALSFSAACAALAAVPVPFAALSFSAACAALAAVPAPALSASA